jgi:hypothetical protein
VFQANKYISLKNHCLILVELPCLSAFLLERFWSCDAVCIFYSFLANFSFIVFGDVGYRRRDTSFLSVCLLFGCWKLGCITWSVVMNSVVGMCSLPSR